MPEVKVASSEEVFLWIVVDEPNGTAVSYPFKASEGDAVNQLKARCNEPEVVLSLFKLSKCATAVLPKASVEVLNFNASN